MPKKKTDDDYSGPPARHFSPQMPALEDDYR